MTPDPAHRASLAERPLAIGHLNIAGVRLRMTRNQVHTAAFPVIRYGRSGRVLWVGGEGITDLRYDDRVILESTVKLAQLRQMVPLGRETYAILLPPVVRLHLVDAVWLDVITSGPDISRYLLDMGSENASTEGRIKALDCTMR